MPTVEIDEGSHRGPTLEDFGYLFLGETPWGVGVTTLEVHVVHLPTERHFDPNRIRFPIATVFEGIWSLEHLTVTHPWQQATTYQAAPGRIELRDRKDKVVEAFSFGGQLTVSRQPSFTRCVLHSYAPILELSESIHSGPTTEVTLFIEELEALLARSRAQWGREAAGYETRLLSIEPQTLFAAGWMGIVRQLHAMPIHNRSPRLTGLLQWMDGLHVAQSTPLDDLLEP